MRALVWLAGAAAALRTPAPRRAADRTCRRPLQAESLPAGVGPVAAPFVDEGECADEICILPPSDAAVAASKDDMLRQSRSFDVALASLPVAAPAVAFAGYTQFATFARAVFMAVNDSKWGVVKNYESVDGGAYEIAILTPTIIGIVVPSLSITYATLTAMTVNTLRQRQLEARIALNRELGDLQLVPGRAATSLQRI